MPRYNQDKPNWAKAWRQYRRFLLPGIFIVLALALTGYVTYDAVSTGNDSNAASEKDDSGTGLFRFKANDSKIIDLIIFRDAVAQKSQIGTTSVMELELDLLQRSLENNLAMPGGNQLQKYNYVVTKEGVIAVAVWSEQAYYDRMYDTDKDPDHCALDDGWSMRGDTIETRPKSEESVMVNIYPETQIPFVSPCWVTPLSGDRIGLLDGSSKHVVLAQGTKSSWNGIGVGWKDARVRGAGEIIVDLRDDCSYTITDNSGTYRPNNFANLHWVALWFTEKLADDNGLPIPPTYLKDRDEDLVFYNDGPTLTGIMQCP